MCHFSFSLEKRLCFSPGGCPAFRSTPHAAQGHSQPELRDAFKSSGEPPWQVISKWANTRACQPRQDPAKERLAPGEDARARGQLSPTSGCCSAAVTHLTLVSSLTATADIRFGLCPVRL